MYLYNEREVKIEKGAERWRKKHSEQGEPGGFEFNAVDANGVA